MSMKRDPLLTQAKFSDLEKKLNHLIKVARPAAAAEVSRLAELGDFSENAEYQLAKGKLRGINSTILLIQSQLNLAEIILPNTQSEVVQIGHTVTFLMDGIEKTYRILGSSETSPRDGSISYLSPIGSALMGRRVGDNITITLASRVAHCVILKIV